MRLPMCLRRPRVAFGLVLAIVSTETVSSVPLHMKFLVEDGMIKSFAKPELRLNVKGGGVEAGDPVVLWPCTAHNHELFELDGSLLRLKANRALCLNVKGGVQGGHNVVTWPCTQTGKPEYHEEFEFAVDGRLKMKYDDSMCINVKESQFEVGAEIIAYACAPTPQENELFEMDQGVIKLSKVPSMHFNIAGGNIQEPGGTVVLWSCSPGVHELFELTSSGHIRLTHKPNMCLNVAGGVDAGNPVVIWHCSDGMQANEKFRYDPVSKAILSDVKWNDGRIMGLNIAGAGFIPGNELVLWPIGEEEL